MVAVKNDGRAYRISEVRLAIDEPMGAVNRHCTKTIVRATVRTGNQYGSLLKVLGSHFASAIQIHMMPSNSVQRNRAGLGVWVKPSYNNCHHVEIINGMNGNR